MRASVLFKNEMQVGYNFTGDKLMLEQVYGVRIENPRYIRFMFMSEANPHMNQDDQSGMITVHFEDAADIRITNDEYEY